jgi:hypothetical protein
MMKNNMVGPFKELTPWPEGKDQRKRLGSTIYFKDMLLMNKRPTIKPNLLKDPNPFIAPNWIQVFNVCTFGER